MQKIKQESALKNIASEAESTALKPKSIRITKKLEKVKTAVNEIKHYIHNEVLPNQPGDIDMNRGLSKNTSHCTYHRSRKNYPLKKSEIRIISDET